MGSEHRAKDMCLHVRVDSRPSAFGGEGRGGEGGGGGGGGGADISDIGRYLLLISIHGTCFFKSFFNI